MTYVPRLWYYHSLRSLSDQTEPRPSLSTLPSTSAEAAEVHPGFSTQEEDVEEPSLTQESLRQSQEEAMPSSLTICQVPPLRPPTKRDRKNKNLDDATAAFLRHATTAISSAPDSQEAFGCMTANTLKEMEEDQHIMCKEIILQALKKGLIPLKHTSGNLIILLHHLHQQHSHPAHYSSMADRGQCNINTPNKATGLGIIPNTIDNFIFV
ncbi:hypothetical protein AB205_0159440 [Aquarana catesbeiana]|uniref:Uncharacterized protein n=1 Tax=Aquarana catesbeiana TaxID=8400 RepID=A0A2G9R6Q0_AQUCT|nr:hypothetical protein AB205_0159440 [Aquarana catesbeiana]